MWSKGCHSVVVTAVAAFSVACGSNPSVLSATPDGGSPSDTGVPPDGGPDDTGVHPDAAVQCPERFYPDGGILTAEVSYWQSETTGTLYALLPAHPEEGVGPVLGCISACRMDGRYPLDGGADDSGPGLSTGRITVEGALGGSVSAEYPGYSNVVTPGPFSDGEPLEVHSEGDPSQVPSMQVGLQMPAAIELVAPASDQVTVPVGQGMELTWTRSSTATVGVVEVSILGQSQAGAFGNQWQGVFHSAHCAFPMAAGRAVIPAEVFDTFDPRWMSLEIEVVGRVRVGIGQGWDANVEARSFQKVLAIDRQ